MTPVFSVIIPLYQSECTISEAIESVLGQTFSSFEIIVVDDGSTDSGPLICRSYTDPRIRVISQNNLGLASARNTGILNSVGSLIAFLDSDDFWDPEKLLEHYRYMAENPLCGISFSLSCLVDVNSKMIGHTQKSILNNITAVDVLCRNPIGNGSSCVIRRKVLDEVSCMSKEADCGASLFWFNQDLRQCEDIELWLRVLIKTNWRIEGIDKNLTFYRVNPSSLSANVEKQILSWKQMMAHLSTYAPAFVSKNYSKGLSYVLRFASRRRIFEGNFSIALELSIRAIVLHPLLFFEDPIRTTVTVLAAVVGLLIPVDIAVVLIRKSMVGISACQNFGSDMCRLLPRNRPRRDST